MKRYIYILFSLMFLIACKNADTIQLESSDILGLKATISNNIPADNYTYDTITAHLDTSLISNSNRNITFTTNLGGFSTGTTYQTTFGDGGIATCYLKSSAYGLATITASVGGSTSNSNGLFSKSTIINFIVAWPDSIYVNLPSTIMTNDSNSTLLITANLLKKYGTPSNNIFVSFSATDTLENKIGTFYSISPSSSNGSATANFGFFSKPIYLGYVIIKAWVTTSNNIVISGKNKVRLVNH